MSKTVSIRPEVGMSVYWYPGGDRNQEPHLALVTGVGQNGATLALHVIERDLKNFRVRDGVRHLDDAQAKRPELQENGAWGHAGWLEQVLTVVRELASSGDKKK